MRLLAQVTKAGTARGTLQESRGPCDARVPAVRMRTMSRPNYGAGSKAGTARGSALLDSPDGTAGTARGTL